jgi:hypothetical protein
VPGGAGPIEEVLARAGWVGHDRGGPGPGSGTAGEAPARAERVGHGQGGPGSGAAGEAPARQSGSVAGEAGVEHRRRGAGCGGSVRSSCGGGGARRYTARGRDEREMWEKERAGPSILSYVCWVDTSADEHKRAGLRGGRGALCSLATRRM